MRDDTRNKMATNKFNFAWQLVRVQARKIKEVPAKIKHVMAYLHKHPNIHNYDRIHNWLKMTQLGYKGDSKATGHFKDALENLEKNKSKYNAPDDNHVKLSDVSTDDIKMVLNDLGSRKYDFQFGATPKAHTEFVSTLEKELERR